MKKEKGEGIRRGAEGGVSAHRDHLQHQPRGADHAPGTRAQPPALLHQPQAGTRREGGQGAPATLRVPGEHSTPQ